MIRKFLLASAALACAGSANALTFYTTKDAFVADHPTAVVLEDFESAGPVNTNLASLDRPSFLFTPLQPGGNVHVATPGNPSFSAASLDYGSNVLTESGNEELRAALKAPKSAIGFDIWFNGLGEYQTYFYSGDTLLLSLGFIGFDGPGFAGISDAGPITRFEVVATNGGRLNTAIDNILGVDIAAVPEPATWASMIAGFAMLGGVMRRRTTRLSFG